MEQKPEDKRNGLIATIALHVALLLLAIFFGLTQQIPAPEEGIAINFGYEETGSGTTEAAPEQNQQPAPQQETQIDNVATQDAEDAPSVTEEKPKKPIEKPVEKPVEKPKEPSPSNALNRALNNTKTGTGEGEGITEGGGDQGDPDGDRNSTSRTGGGGAGGSGDYRLGGRNALNRPQPRYDCPDEGRVVVKVYVDKAGKVLTAYAGEQIPGGPSSTTTSGCLLKRASEAAMATTWAPSATAAETQTGYIIYNFKKQ